MDRVLEPPAERVVAVTRLPGPYLDPRVSELLRQGFPGEKIAVIRPSILVTVMCREEVLGCLFLSDDAYPLLKFPTSSLYNLCVRAGSRHQGLAMLMVDTALQLFPRGYVIEIRDASRAQPYAQRGFRSLGRSLYARAARGAEAKTLFDPKAPPPQLPAQPEAPAAADKATDSTPGAAAPAEPKASGLLYVPKRSLARSMEEERPGRAASPPKNQSQPRMALAGSSCWRETNRNWIDLERQLAATSAASKIHHIAKLAGLSKDDTERGSLGMVYKARVQALAKAYFPDGSHYPELINEDLAAHPILQQPMSALHKRLIEGFLEAGRTGDHRLFSGTDREFGEYRKALWLEKAAGRGQTPPGTRRREKAVVKAGWE